MILLKNTIQKIKQQITKKIYEVLKKIGLDSNVGICLTDGDFSRNYGIVNLHPSRGTHWVCYIKDCYSDSYGCSPPKNFLIT